MKRGYKYTARSEHGQQIEGFIEADDLTSAYIRLKKAGIKPQSVRFDLGHTLHLLKGGEFDPAQLARLYTTLGRRIKNGKSLVDGLASAVEYLTDPRLKQAVLTMRQALQDGQNEYQAMTAAGFPKRDAMVIRSTSEAGRTGDTFLNLAQELTRTAGLRRSIKQVFFLPIAMAVFMYAFFFFALWKIAPATMNFLKQTNLKIKLNGFNQAYFDFANWFHDNLVIGIAAYVAFPVLLIVFLRSRAFKRLIDSLPSVRMLSLKSDHAALWNSFSLLYDAAIPARDACKILADAAAREDSRRSFLRLGKRIDAGLPIEEAVQGCQFPQFIVAGVRSSASGGDLSAGLRDLVRNLEEDVNTATEVLKEKVKLASIIFAAVGILLTAAVSYFPVAGTVLGNV
jgi:Type II secretory pathway, component PulF